MVTIKTVPYDDPVAASLVAATLADLAQRYGGEGDSTPVGPAQFAAPNGTFLVAYVDDVPVGCGAWRTLGADPTAAEIKRMYTAPQARGRGVARAVLAALENSAREAGKARMVLETGTAQPEAIALYAACGYARIPNFGHYKDYPDCVSFGREL